MNRTPFTAILALALTSPTLAAANEFEPMLRDLAQGQIQSIVAEQAMIDAILAQNTRTGAISDDEIAALDQQWRAEVGASPQPMIDTVITHPLADRLRAEREQSGGLFTEIFVMDARGLNVASSDTTSDYWQGDEAKWQQTYAVGPDTLHISDVEFDESTQTYQAQISVPVTDPSTGSPIGAATFGVNVELLN